MKQKSVGLTLRALILALALILVAGSPALPPFDGVAYAQDAEVTDLTWSTLPSGALQLDWDEVAGASSYRLWKGTGSGQSVTWGDTVHMSIDAPTTMYVDNAVTAGMTYSYVIEVYDGDDNRLGWSDVENVTMPGGTQRPTAKPVLTLTADGLNAITITWTEVPGADNYRLRYWTSGLSGWMDLETATTTRTYSHTSLTAGTQYFYIVRGQNAGGNGPYSREPGNYDSLTLEATTTVPQLTLRHPARLRVELSWTRVAAGAMYQVQRKKITTTDGGTPVDSGWANLGDAQSGNTYTDTTVTYGVTDGNSDTSDDSAVYHYQVRAVVNGEEGTWSNSRMATIPSSDALPAPPTGLAAAPSGSNSINVTWVAASDATSYELRYKMGDGEYTTPMTRSTPYLHRGLSAATEYTYQVRSVNVNGHSDWTAEESATTAPASVTGERLATPGGLRAVDATTSTGTPQIKVTWNKVSGVGTITYELRRWNGTTYAELTLSDAEMTSHTDTGAGVEAGTTYYYIVAAIDDNGTDADDTDNDMSDWAGPVPGTTMALKPDAAPASLTVTPRGQDRIWISWPAVPRATEYALEWRRVGTSNWTVIRVMGRTTHAHTGLSANMKYQYRVAGKNSGGMGPYTAEMQGMTWAGSLRTPTGLMAVDATTDTAAAIKLTWNAVSGAAGYELQKWSTTNSDWRALDGTEGVTSVTGMSMTSHTDTGTGVVAEGTYNYIIRAVNGDVRSPWSADVAGTAKADEPGAPTLHLEATGQTMVRLTWAAAATGTSGYTGWEVQYIKGSATEANLNDSNYNSMTLPTLPAMPMHFTHRGLEQGQRYTYRIRGLKALGVESAWSTPPDEIVTRPATPSTLGATAPVSTTMTLTWALVKPPGLATADATAFECGTGYDLQRRASSTSSWTVVDISGAAAAVSGKCTFDDTGLTATTMYYYRIRVATDPTGDQPEIRSYWKTARQTTPR